EALPDLERLNDPKALEPAPQTLLRDAHLLCVGELARHPLHGWLQRGGGERTRHGKCVLRDQPVRPRPSLLEQPRIFWCPRRALVEQGPSDQLEYPGVA